MNAQDRLNIIKAEGLMETPVNIVRNGEHITTLGRLVERDAAVEARGLFRAPHGIEADTLNEAGHIEAGCAIAIARAHSNGRNIFWEGRPGGAASSAEEVSELGPEEARRRAFERKAAWGDMFDAATKFNFAAATYTPEDYALTPIGAQWFANNH